MTRIGIRLSAVAAALAMTACAGNPAAPSAPPGSTPATPTPATPTPAEAVPRASASADPEDPVLVAAGDIASCERDGDTQTAALVTEEADAITTLGDHVYPTGRDDTFAQCYDPAWGGFLDRTHPVPGNHDLETDAGAAYHRYFGDRAGTAGEGWYSHDLGEWHLVALNSNCEVIGCGPGSPQHDWLTADLAASDATCTLAYFHHPRFTSGPHGDYGPVAPLWDALHEAGADVVLVGHDHLYERFAPQAPTGAPDPNGIRQFTVGTGGGELYAATRVAPNSELIIDDAFGVLELTLHPDAYDWRFLTVDGAEADAGTAACH